MSDKEVRCKPLEEIEPVLLSEAEACELLRCSPRTLYNYRTQHSLPFVSFGNRVFYRPESLRLWASQREQVVESSAAL